MKTTLDERFQNDYSCFCDIDGAIEKIEPISGVSKFAKEVYQMSLKTDKTQSANKKGAVVTPTKADLQAGLRQAIEVENYERAVELRDLLNKIS